MKNSTAITCQVLLDEDVRTGKFNSWNDTYWDKEKKIAGLWSDILRIDTVGIDDNFFEAGGDSLRAGQLAARIKVFSELACP
jgi:hypothetical protein